MKWGCLGLNYKTASVEVRERFAVPRTAISEVGERMLLLPGIEGCVILSTCNRMELYLTISDECSLKDIGLSLLKERHLPKDVASSFYYFEGHDVGIHLCEVVSGLDSMVLGETEISGQVKLAYKMASEAQLTDSGMNKLFQKAFEINKKVRNMTSINCGTTSIGSVAVDLAEQIFGDLNETKVLILGAGEMSRVTAQSLRSRGACGIFVANRSYDRAVELAERMDAQAIRFDAWTEYLKMVDIVIASTSAPHYIVHPEEIESIRSSRKYKSLFFIDISVPRNVDPDLAKIDEVYVYDIDTLRQLADEARERRRQEIEHCEQIIQEKMKQVTFNTVIPSLQIGTRGSALALAQAQMTMEALLCRYPGVSHNLEIIKTTGDLRTDVPLSQVAHVSGIVDKGVFIKEIETALYEGKIDVAVHSMKDLPSDLDQRFSIAAVLPRAAEVDVIISKHAVGDLALPEGAVVATSSVRRRRQLKFLRPDVTVVDIRGNVPTRLDKLVREAGWDAVILAQAGLDRLGLSKEILSSRDVPLYVNPCDPEVFLPAAGQGAVALEIRADNRRLLELLRPLNDIVTELRVRAERYFLQLLGAGCSTPIGVYTQVKNDVLYFKAILFDEEHEGREPIMVNVSGLAEQPESVAEMAYYQIKKEDENRLN